MADQHVVAIGSRRDRPQFIPIEEMHLVAFAQAVSEVAANRVGARDGRAVWVDQVNADQVGFGSTAGCPT